MPQHDHGESRFVVDVTEMLYEAARPRFTWGLVGLSFAIGFLNYSVITYWRKTIFGEDPAWYIWLAGLLVHLVMMYFFGMWYQNRKREQRQLAVFLDLPRLATERVREHLYEQALPDLQAEIAEMERDLGFPPLPPPDAQ